MIKSVTSMERQQIFSSEPVPQNLYNIEIMYAIDKWRVAVPRSLLFCRGPGFIKLLNAVRSVRTCALQSFAYIYVNQEFHVMLILSFSEHHD